MIIHKLNIRGTTTTHTQGPQERGVVEAQRKASREGGSCTSAAARGQTVPTGASGWDRAVRVVGRMHVADLQ